MPAIRPVKQVIQDGNLMIRSHPGATLVAAARNGEGAVPAYEVGMIDSGSHVGWSVVRWAQGTRPIRVAADVRFSVPARRFSVPARREVRVLSV
jgi:Pyridoxamine 5'-phosphate oxidase